MCVIKWSVYDMHYRRGTNANTQPLVSGSNEIPDFWQAEPCVCVCVWSPCSVDMKNRQCSSMSIVDRWRPNALVCIHGVYKCVEKVKALHTHFVDIYIYKSVYEFV